MTISGLVVQDCQRSMMPLGLSELSIKKASSICNPDCKTGLTPRCHVVLLGPWIERLIERLIEQEG